MVASLDSRGVEGLIVNPVSYSDPYLMNYSLHGVPVVICDCLIKGYPFSAVLAEVREPVRRLIHPSDHVHPKKAGELCPYHAGAGVSGRHGFRIWLLSRGRYHYPRG